MLQCVSLTNYVHLYIMYIYRSNLLLACGSGVATRNILQNHDVTIMTHHDMQQQYMVPVFA